MDISQERLKEILHYDPETGIFRWREPVGNRVIAGDRAGCVGGKGYIKIKIDGKYYQAHRLAILYTDGYFPENTVDHKNRIRADNRRVNLREASRQCQARNCGMRNDNTTGVKGVRWHNRDRRWLAHVTVNGQKKHLGSFDDFLEAAYHRYAAEQFLGFPDCDINSSAKQFIEEHQLEDAA